LYDNLTDWIVDLHGHQRKVTQIEWHPTAEDIIISSGADYQIILWNLEKAEPIKIITCHVDTIQSMVWSRDGSFIATTSKDKKIRVIDPRTGSIVMEGLGHQGSKISKVVILGCGMKLFTTGFSKLSERQIALWDIRNLSKPIHIEVVDCSSGILIPYYDHDTKIVFVGGKGDGNIRYYEITENTEPYLHYLSEYKSSTPQRGLGMMPKRGLDVTKNEIFRFYKLHAMGGICEPISMIVPRKVFNFILMFFDGCCFF
jgi:coronin-2